MPIQGHFIEPGIYLSRWVSPITSEEVTAATQQTYSILATLADPTHVVLVDMRECSEIPITMLSYIDTVRDLKQNWRCQGYVAIQPPALVQVMIDVLAPMVGQYFQSVAEFDNGLETARQRLRSSI